MLAFANVSWYLWFWFSSCYKTHIISSACIQVTPAQIRDAEKNLLNMEAMIEAMTPGLFFLLINDVTSVNKNCSYHLYLWFFFLNMGISLVNKIPALAMIEVTCSICWWLALPGWLMSFDRSLLLLLPVQLSISNDCFSVFLKLSC